MKSIKTKLMVVLLAIAIIPIVSIGVINFFQTSDFFKKSVQDFLLTIVRSKEDALENYIESTETAGKAISNSDIFQEYIKYTNRSFSAQDSKDLNRIKQELSALIYSYQEAFWGNYHHVFVIDPSYKIAISPNHNAKVKGSPSSHLNEDTSANRWVRKAFSDGVTQVSDYSSWVESDHSHQMVFYPVTGGTDSVLAVIGFELQIPHEEKILSENFEMGETGRIFLITTDGIPIVYRGIDKQVPLNTRGVAEAGRTGYSSGLRKNTDGVEVIDLYLKNKKYPWILVAEIETQEAFRSLYSIQTTLALSLIVVLLVAIGLSIIFAGYMVNPIIKLTKQMKQVSLGKLSIEIEDSGRKDEIGTLILAFKRTIISLKIAIKRMQANKKKA
ncbi:MAG: HAMP domain-containing protein [Gammaproteobacteria bacterium]|nr:HAMP domain-containing protein [Gammaproteobacteria bacterium]